jgi:hypothetical protein
MRPINIRATTRSALLTDASGTEANERCAGGSVGPDGRLLTVRAHGRAEDTRQRRRLRRNES